MNSHSYEHLLDVTHQEFVVIQGNTTEAGQEKTRKYEVSLPLTCARSTNNKRINDLILGSKVQHNSYEPVEVCE